MYILQALELERSNLKPQVSSTCYKLEITWKP